MKVVFRETLSPAYRVEFDWFGSVATTAAQIIEKRIVGQFEEMQTANDDSQLAGVSVDWRLGSDVAVARALEAFVKRSFVLIVDGQQVNDLAEPVYLRERTEILFLPILPMKWSAPLRLDGSCGFL